MEGEEVCDAKCNPIPFEKQGVTSSARQQADMGGASKYASVSLRSNARSNPVKGCYKSLLSTKASLITVRGLWPVNTLH